MHACMVKGLQLHIQYPKPQTWADLEKILGGRAKHSGHKSCSVKCFT